VAACVIFSSPSNPDPRNRKVIWNNLGFLSAQFNQFDFSINAD
jgi:hypothetical protein